ncbi:uncharacterized protein LOC134762748 [Penaeus indicus]|uniref:uncharacterized protein LOC134762748 n=1 Tax=Penaeus indicus TaxID=29960 RepID=UPI00300CA966
MAKFNKVQKKRTQNGMHFHQAKTEANQFKKVKFKGQYTQNGDQTNGVDTKSSDSMMRQTEEVHLSPKNSSETSNGEDRTRNGETGNHSKEKKANKKKCKWRENLKKKKMRANGIIPVAGAPAKRALEEGHEASGPMKRRREEDGTQNGSAADGSASDPKEPAKVGKQFSSNWMQLKMGYLKVSEKRSAMSAYFILQAICIIMERPWYYLGWNKYKGFRRLFKGTTPSLKNLTEKLIGVKIQHGEHSSVQDAQAAMRLYTAFRREWENSKKQFNKKKTASVKEQSKDKKLDTEAEMDVEAE